MSFQFMPWYVGDYIKRTATLSLAEHGAYLLLLGYLWAEEGVLSADESELFRALRADSEEERAAVRKVVARFFEVEDGRLVNKRVSKEMEKASTLSEKRRAAAAKRWAKKDAKDASAYPKEDASADAKGDASCMHLAMHPHPHPHPQQLQLQNPSEPDGSGEPSGPPREPENLETPADLIFGLGVGLLTRSGVADKQARAALGKVRKAVGDEKAAALVAQASATVPALTDPLAWLMAAARGGGESEADRRMRLRREAMI